MPNEPRQAESDFPDHELKGISRLRFWLQYLIERPIPQPWFEIRIAQKWILRFGRATEFAKHDNGQFWKGHECATTKAEHQRSGFVVAARNDKIEGRCGKYVIHGVSIRDATDEEVKLAEEQIRKANL